MSDAPERIFLQDAGDYARASAFEVTWCVEPQDDADTEYIRADKVQALVEENARMKKVYDAAHEWWIDRVPRDASELALSHVLNNTAPEAIAALAALDAKP